MGRISVQTFLARLPPVIAATTESLTQCREVIIQLENARLIAETAWRHQTQEGRLTFRDGWTDWTSADSGLSLFRACLATDALTFSPHSQILEVGCCESDWQTLALHADPTLQVVGLDWRATAGCGIRLKADVRLQRLFPSETFDWVVSLSAIEHVGLGHYDQDPLDPEGDVQAMRNIWTWLKPGGQVYLDVPYRPEGFLVQDTSYRAYDRAAVDQRLLTDFVVEHRWYTAGATSGALVPEPHVTPAGESFVNIAIHASKPA